MRANSKVCLQADETLGHSEWVSVIVNGDSVELREPQYTADRKPASSLLSKQYQWWLNALGERQMREGDTLIDPLFFRIWIQSISGLRATENRSKH